jgi:replicative DNA helicase
MKKQQENKPIEMAPFDEDAERRVIGAAISCGATEIDFSDLHRDDFYSPIRQIIFDILSARQGKLTDIAVMVYEVKEQYDKETSDKVLSELDYCTNSGFYFACINDYKKIIKEISFKREAYHNAHKILNNIREGNSVGELYTKLSEHSENVNKLNIRDYQSGCIEIRDRLNGFMEKVLSKPDGLSEDAIKTGITELDGMIYGLFRKHVIYLGGRPSSFKTYLSLTIANNIAKNGTPVMFYSMELAEDNLLPRLHAISGMKEPKKVMIGKTVDIAVDMARSSSVLYNIPSFSIHYGMTNTYVIEKEVSIYIKRTGLKPVVMIDRIEYITDEQYKNERRDLYFGRISKRLTYMADRYDIPILCLVQLNRESEKENRLPRMSDFRDCGALEQDAKVALFTHRDRNAFKLAKSSGKLPYITIVVDKVMYGETGDFKLAVTDGPVLIRYTDDDCGIPESDRKEFDEKNKSKSSIKRNKINCMEDNNGFAF